MGKPARKYILIPEYRPLFAMSECFGPTHGPLTEPCPTPLSVIRKLLLQTGNEALTIMEVLKNTDGSTTPPVLLTLDNYMLPYHEILNGANPENNNSTNDNTPKEPVHDATTELTQSEETVDQPVPEDTESVGTSDESTETKEGTTVTIIETVVPSQYTNQCTTKAQKKAMKRAEREAELAAAVAREHS